MTVKVLWEPIPLFRVPPRDPPGGAGHQGPPKPSALTSILRKSNKYQHFFNDFAWPNPAQRGPWGLPKALFGAFGGSSGAQWGPLGALWGPSGVLWALPGVKTSPLGRPWGPPWALLVLPRAPQGAVQT